MLLDINIESRGFNQKQYTDVKAWKVQSLEKKIEDSNRNSEDELGIFNPNDFQETPF